MTLVVLTGASGSGKTTVARAIEARLGGRIEVRFFDSIGVPPAEPMVTEYGSGEGWQRAATIEWMRRIAPLVQSGRNVLFEGQTRFPFLSEAIAAASIVDYRLILMHCDDAARTHRLVVERRQPDLTNPTMLSWASFLRNEAERGGHGQRRDALLSRRYPWASNAPAHCFEAGDDMTDGTTAPTLSLDPGRRGVGEGVRRVCERF